MPFKDPEKQRVCNRKWMRMYRLERPDKVRETQKRYRTNHIDEIRERDHYYKQTHPTIYDPKYQRNYRQEQVDVLFKTLGIKCICYGKPNTDCWHDGICGVSDRRILHFDHIYNNGADDRRRFGGNAAMRVYYSTHLDEAKANLQILCANCNWAKRYFK